MLKQIKTILANISKYGFDDLIILQFILGTCLWCWPLWAHQIGGSEEGGVWSLAFFKSPTVELAHPVRMMGLLVLAAIGVACCRKKGCGIIIRNCAFLKLFIVSIAFAYISTESLTHDASQLAHIGYFMASFVLLSIAVLGRYGVAFVSLVFLVLVAKYLVTHVYGFEFNAGILDAILDANAVEIQNFINVKSVSVAIGAVLVVFCLSIGAYWSVKSESRWTMATSACWYIVFAYLGVSMTIPRENRTTEAYAPYSSLWNIQKVSEQAKLNREKLMYYVKNLPSATERESKFDKLNGDDGVVIIVHIGESTRIDHMGYAGYCRETTPWLSKQKNMVTFNHCTSMGSLTKDAIFVMLTDARRNIHHGDVEESMAPTCLSFIDLFAENGFECHAFLHESAKSFQQSWEVYFKTMMDKFLNRCEEIHYYRDSQRKQTEQILREIEKAQQRNLLMIVNNEGSHLPFYSYDEQSMFFTPCSRNAFCMNPDAEQKEMTINAYDNTIVLLDQYIETIVAGLGNRPYVYLYMSDHGEQLGDDGIWDRLRNDRYYHSQSSQIPFFILYSESFRKLHPHFDSALEKLKANTSMSVSQEHLFHTILGIIGIESPYYNQRLDLCTENPEPYSGPRPSILPASVK